MHDVAKNTMNPPISAPTHAGTANKVGALPLAVDAVIGLYIFLQQQLDLLRSQLV